MPVRMKDIAEALNLSIVTVSKVLNGDNTISEPTRQRVLACAKKLDYRTNLAAKGLVTGQSKMVGLIVPDLFHGFFSEVAAGLSDLLRGHGYGLIIASSRDDKELERQEVQQMQARRVDALIVASCELQAGVFDSLAKELPLVLLDRRIQHTVEAGFVGTNNLLAGELATQHLIDIGCRRIAHIGGPSFSPASDRVHAFRYVLKREGIDLPAGYVIQIPQNEEQSHVMGAESMKKLLELKTRPDGVFCYNDATAFGAMRAIFEAGLRIPDDIAVVGCGDIQYNEFLRVPLTSINQDAPRLGAEAGKMALSMIRSRRQGSASSQLETVVKPALTVRASTQRTPKRRRAG
jgi:LacI family transcriptional regulator